MRADYWDLRPQVMEAILTERPDWCADPKRRVRDLRTRLLASLDAALAELRRDYGSDMRLGNGQAHIARFLNRFRPDRQIARLLRVAIPTAGVTTR